MANESGMTDQPSFDKRTRVRIGFGPTRTGLSGLSAPPAVENTTSN